jgi:hypothetical protein
MAARRPPGPSCCIRSIYIDAVMNFRAYYWPVNNIGEMTSDIERGSLGVKIRTGTRGVVGSIEVNKEIKGNEYGVLTEEIKDMALQSCRDYPDRWYTDESFTNDSQDPSDIALEHGEENWDKIVATTNPPYFDYTLENPYKWDFKVPLRRLARDAVFCKTRFIEWVLDDIRL